MIRNNVTLIKGALIEMPSGTNIRTRITVIVKINILFISIHHDSELYGAQPE